MSVYKTEGSLRLVNKEKAEENKDASTGWSHPQPLRKSDYIPDIPLDIIPQDCGIREYVQQIATAYNCQVCAPAAVLMNSICGLVGSRAGIKPYREQESIFYPNVWGGIVAPSGQRKSAIIRAALAPHLKVESVLAVCRKEEEAKRRVDTEALEKKIKSAMKSGAIDDSIYSMRAKLDALKADRGQYRIISDFTVEALGELMVSNAGGITLYRDEMSGLILSLEKENQKGARQFLLETSEGGVPYSIHRIGRGNIDIPNCTTSMIGGFQPDVIGQIVSKSIKAGSATNDGFVQRFQLLVFPEETEYKAVDVSTSIPYELMQLYMGLELELPCTTDESGIFHPRIYQADDKALAYWLSWSEEWMAEAKKESPALRSHYSKYLGLMAGLSLVFALIRDHEQVVLDDMQLASRWCDYLSLHARKMYRCTEGHSVAEKIGQKILNGDIKDGETLRSLKNRNIAGRSGRKEIDSAISELEEAHWIFVEDGAKGSKVIRINPDVHSMQELRNA